MRTRKRLGIIAALGILAALTIGCSLPKVIVLHDPLTPEEHDSLGRIYEHRGEFALAANQYREAIIKDREHLPSFLLLADLAYRTGAYGEAQSAYEKALKLDPKNADAKNNLACVYLALGTELDQAEQILSEAILVKPDRRGVYLDTEGLVLLKKGKVKRAVAILRQAVALLEEDEPELLLQAQQHLAEAYKTAGDDENYQRALERYAVLQKDVNADEGTRKAFPTDDGKTQKVPAGTEK